mgnify:CR=1 FL=1
MSNNIHTSKKATCKSSLAKVTFVTATADDVDFLLELRKLTMTEHLLAAGFSTSDEYHLARIHEHYNDSLIIFIDEQKAGLVKLSKMAASLHIRQLQILPRFQNKGIGSLVLKSVIKKGQSLNLPITLNVLLENPAKGLYQRHGFKITGKSNIEFQMKFQY